MTNETFKPVRVYCENGATFLCTSQYLLDIYTKAGWSRTPIAKPAATKE